VFIPPASKNSKQEGLFSIENIGVESYKKRKATEWPKELLNGLLGHPVALF